MPCDRINTVIRSDINSITRRQNADIHEKYYTPLGTDDKFYRKVRHEIMHAMLGGTTLTLNIDNNIYTLSKK